MGLGSSSHVLGVVPAPLQPFGIVLAISPGAFVSSTVNGPNNSESSMILLLESEGGRARESAEPNHVLTLRG